MLVYESHDFILKTKILLYDSIIWLMFVDAFHDPGTVLMVGNTKTNLIQSMSTKIWLSNAKADREGNQ